MKLQEIRARQAMNELSWNGDIKIDHQKPLTIIAERRYRLVFPRFLLEYPTEKNGEKVSFVGKVTPRRQEFFDKAKALYPTAEITHSTNGRIEETRDKDDQYFKTLGQTSFALCPNGDFVWTYRFFEAVFLKAIPVVEEDCELYDGYKYYKLGDVLEYRPEWVEHNLEKAKKEMML